MGEVNENAVQKFVNEELGFEVDIQDRDGNPWYTARSICDSLEIGNVTDATKGLDLEDRSSIQSNTLGGVQEVLIVSESGMYEMVTQSRKPKAKPFVKWLCKEVLPSIRKTGTYSTKENNAIPDSVVESLRNIVREELAAHAGGKVSTIERKVDRVELTELPAHNWCGNSEESVEDKTERYILHHLGRFGEMTKSQINQYTIWANKEIRDGVLGRLIESGAISAFRVGRAIMFSLVEDETSN